jgi:hypothetical protein
MDLREIGCEDGRWMELAQDHVHCRAVGSGSRSCPMAGFGSSGVEPSGSAKIILVIYSFNVFTWANETLTWTSSECVLIHSVVKGSYPCHCIQPLS